MAHEKERALELLERASYLVGNPGTGISSSTDWACEDWQKEYEDFLSTLPEEKEEKRCKEFIVGAGVNDVLNFIDEATSDCMIMKDLNKPNARYVFDRPIKMTIEV